MKKFGTVRILIELVCIQQYHTFVQERLIDANKPVIDTIKKNNLPLFSSLTKKGPSKEKAQAQALKADGALFSRLYIACQYRDRNLEEFLDTF